MEFKKVLVPYDASDYSNRAVDAACSVAGKQGSVTILNVYGVSVMAYAGPAGIPQENVRVLEAGAKDVAEAVVKKGVAQAKRNGVDAKGEVLEAVSTIEAIIDFAKDGGFDLIVVGTRGNTGFKKLVMGSVSSGVVGHASCPVLVVR